MKKNWQTSAAIDLSTGDDQSVISIRKGKRIYLKNIDDYLGKSPSREQIEGLLELLAIGNE